MDASDVLIVKVPAAEVTDLREFRDCILESLEQGVMVLSQLASYSVESFPLLGGVKAVSRSGLAAGDQVAHATPPAQPGEGDGPPCPRQPREHDAAAAQERKEKQAILHRLKEYRAANGPGCLKAVAAKTRSRGDISDMVLRDILIGSAVLPIESWRKIGRALDRLEEPADG